MAAFSHFLENGQVSSSKLSCVLTSLPVPHSSCEVSFSPGFCEPVVSVGQQRFWLSHSQVPSEPEGHPEGHPSASGRSNSKQAQVASFSYSTPISRKQRLGVCGIYASEFNPQSPHPSTLLVTIAPPYGNPVVQRIHSGPRRRPTPWASHPSVPLPTDPRLRPSYTRMGQQYEAALVQDKPFHSPH